jgi:hypothetical protein
VAIQGDEKRLGLATVLYGTVALSFVIPSVPRISYFTALTSATYVVLPKENHMQLTEAATLDRKSGGSRGICSSGDHSWKCGILPSNKFVISTGAQRSGEICGSVPYLAPSRCQIEKVGNHYCGGVAGGVLGGGVF